MLVVQSCPALWDPMAYGPPGSFTHKILQARILEWVAIPFSKGSNPGLLHCRQILYPLSHQGVISSQLPNLSLSFLFWKVDLITVTSPPRAAI